MSMMFPLHFESLSGQADAIPTAYNHFRSNLTGRLDLSKISSQFLCGPIKQIHAPQSGILCCQQPYMWRQSGGAVLRGLLI